MEWTRSPWMRLLALAAGVALIALNWDEKGGLFWVGIAVVVLNAAALALQRATGAPGPLAPNIAPVAPVAGVEEAEDEVDITIAELLHLPEVAAALAEGPTHWRQVSLFDHLFDPMPVAELTEHMWVTTEEDEDEDPTLAVLAADPRVAESFHEDREMYVVETAAPMTTEEFAALALRALTAHHLRAADRLNT
jgi:hypothetical protein